jgi:hypothetical protein
MKRSLAIRKNTGAIELTWPGCSRKPHGQTGPRWGGGHPGWAGPVRLVRSGVQEAAEMAGNSLLARGRWAE